MAGSHVEEYLKKLNGEEADITFVPQSNVEKYLAKMNGFDVELPAEPGSRVETLLADLAEGGGGGGGVGGTIQLYDSAYYISQEADTIEDDSERTYYRIGEAISEAQIGAMHGYLSYDNEASLEFSSLTVTSGTIGGFTGFWGFYPNYGYAPFATNGRGLFFSPEVAGELYWDVSEEGGSFSYGEVTY